MSINPDVLLEKSFVAMPEAVVVSEAVARLRELLMSPEQLEKVDSLRESLGEKKRRAEAQLLASMQEQLERARLGMEELEESSAHISTVHHSFREVGAMCTGSRNQLPQYSVIKRLTIARENLRSCIENCRNLSEV